MGCYDAAKGFEAHFISGKDSLYNEYTVHGKSLSIPGTLLISAIAVMEDISKAVSMYFKEEGSLIYAVGNTYNELGGSHYYALHDTLGNLVPQVRIKEAKKLFDALSHATQKRLVSAMHDCSEGGLGVALAEMSFSGGLGADIFLKEAPYLAKDRIDDFVLFSESNSRFILEVKKSKQKEFERILRGLPFGLIGCVNRSKRLRVLGLKGKVCINADIEQLKEAWRSVLKW